MNREELRELIARTAASAMNNREISDEYLFGRCTGGSAWLDAADAILTALDEAGFQCVKWLTTEELEASTVPARYHIWTSRNHYDANRNRHMIVAPPRNDSIAALNEGLRKAPPGIFDTAEYPQSMDCWPDLDGVHPPHRKDEK